MPQSDNIFIRANEGVWEDTPDGNKRRIGDATAPNIDGTLFESCRNIAIGTQRVDQDQFHGREEPNPLVMMLDGLGTNRYGDMRFARARTADQRCWWPR